MGCCLILGSQVDLFQPCTLLLSLTKDKVLASFDGDDDLMGLTIYAELGRALYVCVGVQGKFYLNTSGSHVLAFYRGWSTTVSFASILLFQGTFDAQAKHNISLFLMNHVFKYCKEVHQTHKLPLPKVSFRLVDRHAIICLSTQFMQSCFSVKMNTSLTIFSIIHIDSIYQEPLKFIYTTKVKEHITCLRG